MPRFRLIPLTIGLLVPLWLLAQQKDRVENPLAATIEEGLRHVQNQKWVDAVELFQRAIDTSGDELVPVDRYQWHRVRWVIHREIARLPLAGLEVYRKRVDGPARQRLEEAKKDRDFDAMKRLVRDWFASRPSEEAMNLIADEAFVRGDFATAERYWRMLDRPASVGNRDDAPELVYPEPKSDAAAIRARLILIQLFREELKQAETELTAFRKAHPDATGYLAGKQGRLDETLEAILRNSSLRNRVPARRGDSDWPTFGGDPSRDSRTAGIDPRFLPDYPTWRIDLPSMPPSPNRRRRETDDLPSRSSDHVRSLAFNPIHWHDCLLLNDAARVWAVNLKDGSPADLFRIDDRPASVFDLQKITKVSPIDGQLPSRLDTRYTLTLADGAVYARLGAQRFALPTGEIRETDSFVVCLAPTGDGKKPELSLRWLLLPRQEKADSPLVFEGTPIVKGDRLFVGATRLQGGESTCCVACYEGLRDKNPPRLSWLREVGKQGVQSGPPRSRAELLTLGEGSLFYCSPSGTVMSLDALTGKPNWEFRYPKRDRDRVRDAVYGRDLCPCVVADGRVFVAPPDAEKVFALDSFTGRLRWESRNLEVIHLLGVSRGKLICTLDRPIRGICGLDTESGTDRFPDGWLQHDGDGEATFGRGFLADGVVYWPTRGSLHFLDSEDGSPVRQPVVVRDGNFAIEPFGNLIPTQSGLFVAGSTQVWGYANEKNLATPPVKDKPEPKKATAVKPFVPEKEEGDPLTFPLKVEETMAPLPHEMRAEVGFYHGPDRILCFPDRIERRVGSELVWNCLPDEFPSPNHQAGLFSAFRLVGDLLVTIVDESRLAAIDTATGVCRWVQWAVSPRALLGPHRIVFRPQFYADESHLLIQISSGLIRLIETHSGKTLSETACSPVAWKSPPARIARGQVVFARDLNRLALLDLPKGQTVLPIPIPRTGSLSGRPAEVRAWGSELLLGVARYHGYEIDRLDAGFGKSLWSLPTLIPGETPSLKDVSLGERSFQLLTEDAVCSYSRSTGERLWRKPFVLSPGADWTLRRIGNVLLIHPRTSTGDDIAFILESELRRWIAGESSVARWVEAAKKSYHAWRDRRAELIFVDAETGELIQRLTLDAPRGPMDVKVEHRAGSLWVRAGENGYRLK